MPTITDQRAGPKRKEGIQWTDATLNPFKLELPDGKRVNVCVKISEGCRNCYSETMTNHWWPRTETEAGRTFPGFSLPLLQRGTPWLDVELLRKLLRWKPKPPFKSPDGRPKIFCFDMTDFFLDLWPDDFLDQFMAVVAIRQDIDFQILTKRPERMAKYLSIEGSRHVRTRYTKIASEWLKPSGEQWPLPNLWLGVSAENQQRADERIPILMRTPAAVRFASYEPAIGPVDFDEVLFTAVPGFFGSCLRWHHRGECHKQAGIEYSTIDWIIIGGESGHGSRPFNIEWARNTIAQCRAAGVPCFVKQMGARITMRNDRLSEWGRDGDCVTAYDSESQTYQGEEEDFFLEDSHGGDPAEWPEFLRVREWPKRKVSV